MAMLEYPSYEISRMQNLPFPEPLGFIDKLSESKRKVYFNRCHMIMYLNKIQSMMNW